MADSKITGLGQLSATPADDDWLVIVDKSDTTMGANGSNKKIAADYFIRTNGTANTIKHKLVQYGTASSYTAGPHVEYITTASAHPVLQFRNYTHDNIAMTFDGYWNGSQWTSSDAGSSFQLLKNSDRIYLRYDTNSVGSALTWNNGWVLDSSGNLGIQTATPSYPLDVNGQAHASGFPTSSDERLKTNIRPFNLTSSIKQKLNSINAYLFEWDDNYKAVEKFKRGDGQTKDVQIGFIAQEVRAAVPQLITEWVHEGIDGTVIEDALAVDYTRFIPIMWEAIKELYAENAALKQRVTALENAP